MQRSADTQPVHTCAGASPALLQFTTLQDTLPPQPSGQFASLTEQSFSFSYSQDEPGLAYYVLVVPADQRTLAQSITAGSSLRRGSPDLLQGSAATSRSALESLACYTSI